MSEFNDLSKEINLMKKLKKKKVSYIVLLNHQYFIIYFTFQNLSYDNVAFIYIVLALLLEVIHFCYS